MGLKDIVAKAKQVHTITIHGTQLRFCELGYDAEQVARAAGREYAKKQTAESKVDEYGSLYMFLEMFRKGGEVLDDSEFFGLSTDYHQEIAAAVSSYLQEKVHTEGRRLAEELRDRLKAKKLEQ